MSDERRVPEWGQVAAAALGLFVAIPFAYVMVVEWIELVKLGDWFAYAMAG